MKKHSNTDAYLENYSLTTFPHCDAQFDVSIHLSVSLQLFSKALI